MEIDPENPFHQASFYLEDMKWGVGPKKVERPEIHEFRAQIECLLREARITSLDADGFADVVRYYSDSWLNTLVQGGAVHEEHAGQTRLIIHSIYMEGVMHGIAFTAGLKGSNPYEEG